MGKKKKVKKKAFIFLIIFVVLLVCCSIFLIDYALKRINGESKYLHLELNGDKEISVKFKEEYKDEGAKAFYKEEDLTKEIKTSNNLDLEHVGTYKYTYEVNYKKQTKKIERTVKVIDDEKPVLKLNGSKEISILISNKYKDSGATATDNYDGDITKNIEVDSSKLDTSKIGKYKVTYKVSDSSGNESEIQRTVNVVKKASANQRVPVLNYHFFYGKKSEGCNEDLCLRIDRFEEQLKYLKDNGFYTLTMDEFVKWMYGEIEIPEKSVLITIDDGAFGTSKIRGNYLIPALEKYEAHATLFLITGWWGVKGGIDNYKSDYLDVQSHTHDLHYEAHCGHRSKVNCVSYDELLKDLKESLKIVDNNNSFCFPFYDYTETSIKAVKEAGFKVAFIGGGRKASRSDDKYKIPRYPIYDSTSMDRFKSIVN